MSNLFVLIFMLTCIAGCPAMAAGENIDIISPVEGAKLDSKAKNKMDYNVTLGVAGGHIHLYLDGEEVGLLREKKGSYTLEPLTKGKHELCLKIVNKNHTPIGVERCVTIMAE